MTAMFFHPDKEELLVEFPNGAKAKVSISGNTIEIQAKPGHAFLNPSFVHDYSDDGSNYLMGLHVRVSPK